MEDILMEAAVDVGTATVKELITPSARVIGENIGLFVDGVIGNIGLWGKMQKAKREQLLIDYKERIKNKIDLIPPENLVEPEIKILGPTIEASKYYIEDDYCREMFSRLIASACDSTLVNLTHPSFIEIIKELSPLDAKYLLIFTENNTYPAIDLIEIDSNNKMTPFLVTIMDYKNCSIEFSMEEQIKIIKTIDNLLRLRLIKKDNSILELNYNYNLLKSTDLYKACENKIDKNSKLQMNKYRIELSEFGKDFVRCCIQDKK